MTTQMNFDWLRNDEKIKSELDSRSFQNATSSRKYTKEHMLSLYNPLEDAEFTSEIRTENKSINILDNNVKSFMQTEPFSVNNNNNNNSNNNDNESIDSGSDMPLWAGVSKNDIGSFDTNGVYHLSREENPILNDPLEEEENRSFNKESLCDLPSLKSNNFSQPQMFMHFEQQKSHQWIYRDPSGHIQGPFSSQDMQEWFQSGYFDLSLMVKRQDAPYFEPLAALVRNNPKAPFLATWPPSDKQSFFQNNMMRPSISTPVNNRFSSPLDAYPISPTEDIKRSEFNLPPPPLPPTFNIHSLNKNDFMPHLPMSPPKMLPPSLSAQTGRMFNQNNDNNAFIPPPPLMATNRNWNNGLQEPWEMSPFSKPRELYEGVNQQQIEQRYLQILKQNHQQSFQLQQKMLQQQQLQRQYMFVKNEPSSNFDQNLPHPIMNVSNQNSLFEDVNQITDNLSNFKLKEETKKDSTMDKTSNSTVWGTGTLKKSLQDDQFISKANTQSNIQKTSPPQVAVSFSATTATRVQPKTNQWGASGRPKRASMTGNAPIIRQTEKPVKPVVTNKSKQEEPSEAFCKWCKVALRELNSGVNVDEILQMLLSFPVDDKSSIEIIQDIIYANSASMDGRRFASDFMKRRKADMNGELSALLPKMLITEDDNSFKVVTKKGRKKFHH